MLNVIISIAYAHASERKFTGVVLVRAYKVKTPGQGMPNGRC